MPLCETFGGDSRLADELLFLKNGRISRSSLQLIDRWSRMNTRVLSEFTEISCSNFLIHHHRLPTAAECKNLEDDSNVVGLKIRYYFFE